MVNWVASKWVSATVLLGIKTKANNILGEKKLKMTGEIKETSYVFGTQSNDSAGITFAQFFPKHKQQQHASTWVTFHLNPVPKNFLKENIGVKRTKFSLRTK